MIWVCVSVSAPSEYGHWAQPAVGVDSLVQKAAQGRMHHRYINLEREPIANARALIRDLGKEIIRLRTMLTDKRS